MGLPSGPFDVVLADPAWRYSFSRSESRRIENQYQTMNLQDIQDLPVREVVAKDAVLYLWGTAPKLREAFSVMDAWGFDYKTGMVWDKKRIGMGYWARGRHEHLLIGTIGKFKPPLPEAREPSIIEEARGQRHSQKPEGVYRMLERQYPLHRKLELFARRRRPGWVVWGNEV